MLEADERNDVADAAERSEVVEVSCANMTLFKSIEVIGVPDMIFFVR